MLSEEEKQKAVADLYAPLENRLMFSRAAFDITANYKYIEGLGKEILSENMKYCKENLKLPLFDPDNPYEDYDAKNMYFSAANNLCQYSLWRYRLYDLAEKYYHTMLTTIKQFENDNKYNHNKGMVYANLGIAQAVQLRIDEGFANILKALDEDRGYFKNGRKPVEEFFSNPLFRQLEKILVLGPLGSQIDLLKKEGETCPIADEFLKGLDSDQRIFFEYTYAKILKNHNVWKEKPNRFSANRMIAYLQDLCLFAEDFLKRKGYSGMLKDLISDAFSGVDLSGCGADSYEELNDKLEKIYGETSKRDRALRILLTLRNFSSHNISAGESVDFIFRNFAEVLSEILRAVIYIYGLPPKRQEQI